MQVSVDDFDSIHAEVGRYECNGNVDSDEEADDTGYLVLF